MVGRHAPSTVSEHVSLSLYLNQPKANCFCTLASESRTQAGRIAGPLAGDVNAKARAIAAVGAKFTSPF